MAGGTAVGSGAVEPGTRIDDIDIGGVIRCLPHRFPFLFIDAVREIVAHERAVGIKQVTINEPYFQGHFPTDPIMPGVLLIEAMAQTAAVLVITSAGPGNEGSRVYFMGVDEARFRRPVRPGDQLRLEIVILRSRLGVWKFEGRAKVGDELAAQAVFSAKVMGR